MYTFEVWVRINAYQTVHVRINANDGLECKMIAESTYGQGNVLNYSQIS